MENVLILGAGAIGQWLAALFSFYRKSNVTVFCREHQKAALEARDIQVSLDGHPRSSEACIRFRPRYVSSLAEIDQPFDLVVGTVKAHQLGPLIDQVAPVAKQWKAFSTFQNGWGTDPEALRLPESVELFASTATIAVGIGPAGEIFPVWGKGGFASSFLRANRTAHHPLWFGDFGVPCKKFSDWRSMKFSKMLLNIICNGSCAILDMNPAEVVSIPKLFAVEMKAVLEGVHLSRRMGIQLKDLPGYPVRQLTLVAQMPHILSKRIAAPRIAKARGKKEPSFLLDVRAGRATEAAYLNGAIADESTRLGMKAPINSAINQILSDIERDHSLWEQFRKNPDAYLKRLSK